MRALINSLLVAASLVALALGWKLLRPQPTTPPPPPPPVEARCDEVRGPIPAVRPELAAATLTVVDGGVEVTVDGQKPGPQLIGSLHLIEAEGVRVQVRVEPFASIVLDVRTVEGVPTVLVVGATCATCPHSDTELDLTPTRGAIGSPLSVAGAVAKGDWVLAVQQLRGLPDSELKTPTLARLVAIVQWLAGHPSRSREWLALLPKRDPLQAVLKQRDADELHVAQRQLATASARWNALTERYQRLTDTFVGDAPALTTELTARFDGYSTRVVRGVTAQDGVATELVLQEATDTLALAATKLRAMKADCEWQRRVWSAL